MLSERFQRNVYEAYKDKSVLTHGKYIYSIAYNATCGIHTWIIRRARYGLDLNWHWLQPLDEKIN